MEILTRVAKPGPRPGPAVRLRGFRGFTALFLAAAGALGLAGCAVRPLHPAGRTRDRAFIEYWPPGHETSRLRLAVKDVIDIKGTVTSAGSEYLARHGAIAERDAACLRGARAQHVAIVGKTNLTEFALGTTGMNDFFGTPRNRLARGLHLVPGGSSSGSAVAVADHYADVAFGTDTAGSIRVPAACCGIFGLKTTLHRIPLTGVYPISPQHLDTVGPMAADLPNLVKGMDLLEPGFAAEYQRARAGSPSPRAIRIGRLYVAGTDPAIDQAVDRVLRSMHFDVITLDAHFVAEWEKAKKLGRSIALADGYKNLQDFLTKPGVTAPTKATILLGAVEDDSYRSDLAGAARWQREMRRIFRKVDFIAVPTLRTIPPTVPFFLRVALFEQQMFDLQNTVPVNVAGNPALAMPIPLHEGKVPCTSLQLIGPNRSEAKLLNVGRLVASRLAPRPGAR